MAVGAGTAPMPNGTHEASKPVELGIDLPGGSDVRINLHVTVLATTILVFLSSTSAESSQTATPMGSFVYAMPDRYNTTQPMSTALYSSPSTLDFATRVAKVLVRKVQKPCYVGSSIDLGATAGGGTMDDERAAFQSVVAAVTALASTRGSQ